MRKFTLILCGVLLAVAALFTVLVLHWMREIPDTALAEANMVAGVSDAGGVDPSSAFILTLKEPVNSVAVQRILQVEPEIEVGVHQGTSRNEILIVPGQPLTEGECYTFTLESNTVQKSWAFQVKQNVSVVSHMPAQQETGVSLLSSIEIVFDQALTADTAVLNDCITITPPVAGGFVQQGRVLRFVPDEPLQEHTVYTVTVASGLPFKNTSVVLAEDSSFSFETTGGSGMADFRVSAEACYTTKEYPRFEVAVSPLLTGSFSEDGEDTLPQVQIELYKFAEARDYAAVLEDAVAAYPEWAQGRLYLHGLATENADLRSRMKMTLQPAADGYVLDWPTVPPAGYYLLRVDYKGLSRDVMFCVSDFAPYVQADSREALLWVNDVTGTGTDGLQIAALYGAANKSEKKDDWACMSFSEDVMICEGSAEDRSFVLPVWRAAEETSSAGANWRYLYLDSSCYQSGDDVFFFGLVQPRDGSALEYSRVSVYVFAEDGQEVLKSYAGLENNIFSGTVTLPELCDGSYSLQIWQSGVMLVEKAFCVGNGEEAEQAVPVQNGLPPLLKADRSSYAYGESFSVEYTEEAERYLFVEKEAAVTAVSSGKSGLYVGEFTPQNMLDQTVNAVAWDGSTYCVAEPLCLALDYASFRLQVRADLADSCLAGEAVPFTVTVTDAAGNAVADAAVAVTVGAASAPLPDPVTEIYEDYRYTLPDDAADRAVQPAAFTCVSNTDAGGTAQGVLTCKEGGKYAVTVQVLHNGQGGVKAEAVSTILYVQPGDVLATAMATPPSVVGYKTGVLEDGTSLQSMGGEEVLYIAEEHRIRLFALLAQSLSLAQEQITPSGVSVLAKDSASFLLKSYLGELVTPLLPQDSTSFLYQNADGGILLQQDDESADLHLSVLAAALPVPGVAKYRLNAYFDSITLYPDDTLSLLMALTGKALLGEPVLNDINRILAEETLTEEEMLWAVWALYASNDDARADQLFEKALGMSAILPPQMKGLCAVLYSYRSEQELAVAHLSLGADYGVLEQLLVAQTLIPQTKQENAVFAYRLNDTPYEGTITEPSGFLLPLKHYLGSITFSQTPEGYGYLHLYGVH